MGKTRWLTPEIVVATAVELTDHHQNLDTLKLKDVAAALNVRVPSLYNHVDGLTGLKQLMTLTLLREMEDQLRQAAFQRSGMDALRTTAHAYRSFAHAHPGCYPLVTSAPEADDAEHVAISQSILQILLLMLGGIGQHGENALHALRGFRALIHGFVSLELSDGFKMSLDRDTSFDYLLDIYLGGLERG